MLGDSHPDTIVSIHNLAELFSARGDRQEEAASLQRRLVGIFEASGYSRDSRDISSSSSSARDDAAVTSSETVAGAVDVGRDHPTDPLVSSVESPHPLSAVNAAAAVAVTGLSPSEEARRPLPGTDPFSSGIHKPSARRRKRS